MLCEVCKTNEARVFLTQIMDGNMTKTNFCEACAEEKGVLDEAAQAALRKARRERGDLGGGRTHGDC